MAEIRIVEQAPAKINLYLDVLGLRTDGFHDIETVMQTVSLSDELIFTYSPHEAKSVSLRIEGNDTLVSDERNLVIRAIREFEKHRPIAGKLDVTLIKRIPTEAGLGGGSADAAATLRALNRLVPDPLDDCLLLGIAVKLGSDVPFCISGGRAICRGRGERISPLADPQKMHLVIVNSGENVSTPKAYSDLDAAFGDYKSVPGRIGAETALASLKEGREYRIFNIFEAVILPACPLAKRAKERLISLGASAALMSGSGPTVFGIFDSQEKAKNAAKAMETEISFVSLTETTL